ncbi:MAG TPA: non-canonical purine NTP pyrophosphatase, partial [Paludibacter sp.]
MDIRLATGNSYKVEETMEILKGCKINIIPYDLKIEELQTLDVHKLVRDKLLKAFSKIGRPLIVEHTGLYIKYLNDFPGGLTQIFWDSLQADKFAEIVGNLKDTTAMAKTVIGFCDGEQIYFFEGEVEGKISNNPLGSRDFQWDCVFIP